MSSAESARGAPGQFVPVQLRCVITMEGFHEQSTASASKEPFIAYEEGSRLLLLRIKRHLHPSHHR